NDRVVRVKRFNTSSILPSNPSRHVSRERVRGRIGRRTVAVRHDPRKSVSRHPFRGLADATLRWRLPVSVATWGWMAFRSQPERQPYACPCAGSSRAEGRAGGSPHWLGGGVDGSGMGRRPHDKAQSRPHATLLPPAHRLGPAAAALPTRAGPTGGAGTES